MCPNGPAIKGVSVAERVKAGAEKLSRGRVLVPAVKSEAWRGFCRPVASFLSFTSVAVQCFLWTDNLSPYTYSIESSGAVTVMSPYTVLSWKQERFAKTVTSLITFIVRVSGSSYFIFRLLKNSLIYSDFNNFLLDIMDMQYDELSRKTILL